MRSTHTEATDAARSGVFDRVLCGVDETPASLEAVRQAGRLRAPGGSLRLVGVLDVAVLVKAGWFARVLEAELRRRLAEVLAEAARAVPDAVTEVVDGSPSLVLLEAAKSGMTLVAVGTHGGGRAAGILLGSVATEMVHRAPCSVLVARRASSGEGFHGSVLAAVDGSPHSLAALAAARELGARLRASVHVVAASGGKPVDVDGLRRIDDLQWDERPPVDALVARSADADLVVLGSRGLHGVDALGSVSERVAHRAHCSVLVVRPPGDARAAS